VCSICGYLWGGNDIARYVVCFYGMDGEVFFMFIVSAVDAVPSLVRSLFTTSLFTRLGIAVTE